MAAGHCDIYCHAGIRCWDMAAGAIIVKEAGGVVVDPETGEDFDLMSRRILVASSQKLVDEWMKEVNFKLDKYSRDYPEKILPLV